MPDRVAVPAVLSPDAVVPGLADVRVWGDAHFSHALLQAELPRLKAKYEVRETAQAKGAALPPVSNLLAISGGADDGAFGAGLLVGWSAQGSRPEFDLVTGISAGALIAPFAFLGRDHDRELAGLFTSYGADQIYQANVLSGLLGGNALADSAPLARLIEHYVDGRFLRFIAAERAKGRFLLVGTTNLDAQRPVYWDMGKIAQKGNAQALDLFRRVLLASASIPGVFPPVLVEVQAGGHLYQEMHVDGGTTREVFFTIADFRFDEIDQAIGRKIARRLWIIRNGKIDPEYKAMPEATLAIAQRSLETLTKSRGIGDLARMYARAKADHIDYNLAAIPADFDAPHPRPFDRAYMQALYERGLAMGRTGHPWAKAPPESIVEARR
ncbi:MAG TPA: patatin-like phospholipase family protein [Hyphomicrobiaceae bacterium]|nr:patatin-like phospholipase family protein [Hyphomicrobiaceae bacterium]